jgi:hypothetical protein
MSLSTETKVIIAGAAVALIAVFYGSKKLVDAAEQALPYINPADSRNVINQGVNGLGELLSGEQGWTLGGSIYDATHGGALDWGGVVNPTSNNNIINQGVSGIGGAVTGNKDWTLGGWIYDVTH